MIWDSGLKIVKKPIVFVPYKLQAACRYIQQKIGYKEFSILARGRWTEEGFELSEDYVVPEQEVTSSSVDYLEPLENYKREGYNTVIHSHPFSEHTDFSMADEETINTHFDCSLLLNARSEFVKAVISVQVNNHIKLQIPAEIKIVYPEVEVPDTELSKIREKKIVIQTPTLPHKKNRRYDDDYPQYFYFP